MKLTHLLPLVASLATALPMEGMLEERQAACATGVHIIIARASTEAPSEGIIGAVATQVEERIPGSDSEATAYPAFLFPYQPLEAKGVAAITSVWVGKSEKMRDAHRTQFRHSCLFQWLPYLTVCFFTRIRILYSATQYFALSPLLF